VKISWRLTIAFAIAALVPLFLSGVFGLRTSQRANELATTRSSEILEDKGKEIIRHRAQQVAIQIESYLASHPEVDLSDIPALQANTELGQIAVQRSGEKDYTAVFDQDAITHFHVDPNLIGFDLSNLAEPLPEFWDLLSSSLDGNLVEGYYGWKDPDDVIRRKYMSIVPVAGTPLRVAATTYVEEFARPVVEVREELEKLNNTMVMQWTLGLVVVAIVSVVGAWLLGQWISKPVTEMVDATERVAAGDLTIDPPSGLIGEAESLSIAFGQMTTNLRSLIRRLQTTSLSLSSAAEQVMMTQRLHAANAAEQAAAVSSASAATEELATSSAHIAETTQRVVAAADQAQGNAHRGVEVMAEAAQHLRRIATGNEAAVEKVRDLGELARQIGLVMDLIEDIAAQTKMIAFNASIEASASGEAGRRFAIVAAEVRRLADDVARSTEEIRTNVEQIQTTTNELIITSERESKEIEGGLAIGDTMSDLLDQIHQSAQQTTVAVQQISLSTQQQRTATEQLLADLQPVTSGAETIASGANETVGVMDGLVTMSQDLRREVNRFKLPEETQDPADTDEQEAG
jgi:methyl-accepting chemotaxis protein